jgi:hypothetical protein
MKILLVNIDSKIPNLALEKIKMFYKDHTVTFNPAEWFDAVLA